MKFTILLFFSIIIISCTSFSSFYTPWIDSNSISNFYTLNEGEEPKIINSIDIDEDMFELLSENYLCIGDTKFNGPDENQISNIKNQCRKNGATVALYSKIYTRTDSGVYSSGDNIRSYNVRRYDYRIMYFAQKKTKDKIGWWLIDLDSETRQKYQRNTGAIVYVVYNDSPVFYANIVRGDVIIRIDLFDNPLFQPVFKINDTGN
jgi:hypothetical protein